MPRSLAILVDSSYVVQGRVADALDGDERSLPLDWNDVKQSNAQNLVARR